MSNVKDNLVKARFKAVHKFPYMATAAFAVQFKETDHPDLSMGVDKYWRLYYNPEKIAEWSVNELMGGFMHELHHLLRNHHARYQSGMQPEKWNLATDVEINDDLRDAKIVLPEGVIMPEDIPMPPGKELKDNQLAERYYEQILDQPTGPDFGGSCADGIAREYEEDPESDPTAKPQSEADLIRDKTAKDIQQAAKSRGDIPSNLKRWAEGHNKSKVNWKKKLAGAIRSNISHSRGSVDYSYSTPSRRRNKKFILPGMIEPNPNIAVVIDTSGSMGNKEVSASLRETESILSHCGQRDGIRVLSVDAQVHKAKTVFSKSQIELFGGGGTDMRLGMDAAHKMKPRPDVCVVITDGFTPWPDQPYPGMRVVTCLVNKSGRSHVDKPWCTTILVEAEDE